MGPDPEQEPRELKAAVSELVTVSCDGFSAALPKSYTRMFCIDVAGLINSTMRMVKCFVATVYNPYHSASQQGPRILNMKVVGFNGNKLYQERCRIFFSLSQ